MYHYTARSYTRTYSQFVRQNSYNSFDIVRVGPARVIPHRYTLLYLFGYNGNPNQPNYTRSGIAATNRDLSVQSFLGNHYSTINRFLAGMIVPNSSDTSQPSSLDPIDHKNHQPSWEPIPTTIIRSPESIFLPFLPPIPPIYPFNVIYYI